MQTDSKQQARKAGKSESVHNCIMLTAVHTTVNEAHIATKKRLK